MSFGFSDMETSLGNFMRRQSSGMMKPKPDWNGLKNTEWEVRQEKQM